MALFVATSSPMVSASMAVAFAIFFYLGRTIWKARAPMRRMRRLGKVSKNTHHGAIRCKNIYG